MVEYFILFFWAFLSATFIPVGSEPYFIHKVIIEDSILLPVIVASLGNIMGGVTLFFMGKMGSNFVKKQLAVPNKNILYAKEKVQKYGPIILLFSWVPIIGDIFVLVAGILKTATFPSILFMSIGKILRYLFLAVTTMNLVTN